jgi:hypothetical protein
MEHRTRFSERHVATLASKFEAAQTQLKCDNLQTAKKLFEEVIQAGTDLFGNDHPDILASKHEYKLAYFYID